MSTPTFATIEKILSTARTALPRYLQNPADFEGSRGNVSICVIDAEGTVHAAMFGPDKIASRGTFHVAWRKASQVWISGYATGQFEKLVYAEEVDLSACGLMHPDLIGWEGGWPILLPDGSELAVAVSGMRGISDTALVLESVAAVGGVVKPNLTARCGSADGRHRVGY